MQSPKSRHVARASAIGSNGGKSRQEGQRGSRKSSRYRRSRSCVRSPLVEIPVGVPCVLVSAAFRGPRFVSEFQRDLVRQHIPLARQIARYFAGRVFGRGPSADELRSAAYEGLCIAALRYVEARGSFKRYAGIWIKREIRRRIAAGIGPVSRPRKAVDRARAIARQRLALSQQRGEEISDEDLSAELIVPIAPPHHHQRRNPETAEEIRQLDSLLRQRPFELQLEDHIAMPEPDPENDLPPVSAVLERLLDGWSVAEVARLRKHGPARVQARIANEVRRFFRN